MSKQHRVPAASPSPVRPGSGSDASTATIEPHHHAVLARNILSNWITMGLTIVSTFFITPIVVSALQKEMYGVWSFLNGLLAYSDLLYLGLGAALIKNVAAYRAKSDQGGLNRLASVVVTIYVALGLISVGSFAVLSMWVPQFFAQPLSVQARSSAETACLLLGVQLLFNFVGSGFAGILYGLDRVDLINVVRIISLVGRSVAIIALIDGAHSLVTLAWITAATAAFEAVGVACLAFWVDRTLVLRPVVPRLGELRFLYTFGLQSVVVIFATTLISYTDTTVIGVTLGAASVAVYSLPLQLIEYVRIAARSTSGVLLPRLTVLSSRGDMSGLQSAYVTGNRCILFLTAFMTANMMVLGSPFLDIWIGTGFGDQVQWVIVCLALATLLHIFSVVIPYSFYQAMDVLGVPAKVLLAEALANCCLSLFLAPRFGIVGVAVGTLIPAVTVSCLMLPPFLWRKLSVPASVVWSGIVPSVVLLVVVTGVQWGLGFVLGEGSYLVLAARVALTVPLLVLIFVLLFPTEDRRWFVAALRGVVGQRSLPAAELGPPQTPVG
jgi:O-antigen/teichoic acid export membrane protein